LFIKKPIPAKDGFFILSNLHTLNHRFIMLTTLEHIYNIYLETRNISTDSRNITPGCLFFALKGESFDGNKFVNTALESGASYAVIDNEKYAGSHTLLVEDVLCTLQQLARMHRRRYNFPVLAITGSNGKTTTKELINAVLGRKYHVIATKGNLNNHIGVPLTLLRITDETQLAIIEMGANHQGEIAQLCTIAEPTHGLITNIGRAHLGGFGGFEGVIKAKSELYTWLHTTDGEAFVNAGNALLMNLSSGIKRILYGTAKDSFSVGQPRVNTEMLEVEWITGAETIELVTNLVGKYNFENVMAAVCTGMYFKVPLVEIKSAVSTYLPSNSRSQAIKTERNSIILDAYNANPTSMQAAIDNFRQDKTQYKMVILGEMLELGDESQTEHLAVAKLVEESGFSRVILVGLEFMKVNNNRFICFMTSDEARDWLLQNEIKEHKILIKGSRGIKMEKVLDAL